MPSLAMTGLSPELGFERLPEPGRKTDAATQPRSSRRLRRRALPLRASGKCGVQIDFGMAALPQLRLQPFDASGVGAGYTRDVAVERPGFNLPRWRISADAADCKRSGGFVGVEVVAAGTVVGAGSTGVAVATARSRCGRAACFAGVILAEIVSADDFDFEVDSVSSESRRIFAFAGGTHRHWRRRGLSIGYWRRTGGGISGSYAIVSPVCRKPTGFGGAM